MGQEKEIFRDVYNLLLKYIAMEDVNDTVTIEDDVSEIAEMFNQDKLCRDLLMAVVGHIERKFNIKR